MCSHFINLLLKERVVPGLMENINSFDTNISPINYTGRKFSLH